MTVKEKINNLKAGTSYTIDFSDKDDRAYYADMFGGEENLKKDFPKLYECYKKAILRDSKTNPVLKSVLQSKATACGVMLTGTVAKGPAKMKAVSALSAVPNEKGSKIKIESDLGVGFGDISALNSEYEARNWLTATVNMYIKREEDGLILRKTSCMVEDVNKYKDKLTFDSEQLLTEGYSYSLISEIKGIDPDSASYMQISKNSVKVSVEYAVRDVILDDPIVKNTLMGKNKNEILMLYGRYNQLDIYKYADYSGSSSDINDYYKNSYKDGKVRLLIPLKGTIIWSKGIIPKGIDIPPDGTIERPFVNYSNKLYSYYRNTDYWTNDVLHEKVLSKCAESVKDGELYKTSFNIKDPSPDQTEERSELDWYIDVEGQLNEIKQTIMLNGGFCYKYQTEYDINSVQISIVSASESDMKEKNREYYKFDQESSTIYIPPIVIYWGCFGKDSKIKLADGSDRRAADIEIGNKLIDYKNRELTVSDIVKGEDLTIFHIVTDKGEMKVSGGHQLMDADGNRVRARKLKNGDMLTAADGSIAVIQSNQVIDYNDIVYNFTFEEIKEGTYLLADGFYSGDLNMQNAKPIKKNQIKTAQDKEIIYEMRKFYKSCCKKDGSLN